MSNEDLPTSDELASAYLDGELEGPERAAAAGDPGVVAAIESFTRVRSVLGEIGSVDPTVKDSAIAAALAEFDAIHPASTTAVVPDAATVAAAPVVSLQSRRHRAYRVISGVAAAAIIGVVAVAALNSTGGNNDNSASSGTVALAVASAESGPELKSAPADAGAATEAAPAATQAAASAAGADSTATTVAIIESTQALSEFAATMEAVDTVSAAPAVTAAPAAPPPAAAPTAQEPAAVAGYAAVPCLSSDQSVLGSINYRGTPALAVRNTETGTLQAIAYTDCRVLAEVPIP